MKTVAFTCPFVPPEWIHAHGLLPHRIVPNGEKSMGASEGMCAFANAFTHAAETHEMDAIIFTTMCDQMRRGSESFNSQILSFTMHVPMTWQNESSKYYYQAELERLGQFLIKLGGCTADANALRESMQEYQSKRNRVLASRENQGSRCFAQQVLHLYSPTSSAGPADHTVRLSNCIPIAMIGGPMFANHLEILDMIEDGGGSIALMGNENGEASFPADFKPALIKTDPMAALVESYFESFPHVSRRPNSVLYSWLEQRIQERGIRALIMIRHSWCDRWHAEIPRMKEHFQLPLLDLELGTGNFASLKSRLATRVGAFLESLQ